MFEPSEERKAKPMPYGGSGDSQPGVQARHQLCVPRQPGCGLTSGSGLGTVAQLMFSQLALNVPSQVWAVTLLLRTCIVILFPTILPISPCPHGPWRQQTLMLNVSAPVDVALISFPLISVCFKDCGTHGPPAIWQVAAASAVGTARVESSAPAAASSSAIGGSTGLSGEQPLRARTNAAPPLLPWC